MKKPKRITLLTLLTVLFITSQTTYAQYYIKIAGDGSKTYYCDDVQISEEEYNLASEHNIDDQIVLTKKSEGYQQIFTTEEGMRLLKKAVDDLSDEEVKLCYSKFAGIDRSQFETDFFYYTNTLSDYKGGLVYKGPNYEYSDYYFSKQIEWFETLEEEAILTNRVNELLPSLNQGSTYDKIKNVHDYICRNVNYCYDTVNGIADNYSAYDALIGGKAVCKGYALLFQKFMDTMGIPCYIAYGTVGDTGHAWNIVQLDGQWYHIDCTWDAQDWGIYYGYFLLGSDIMNYTSWGIVTIAPESYNFAGIDLSNYGGTDVSSNEIPVVTDNKEETNTEETNTEEMIEVEDKPAIQETISESSTSVNSETNTSKQIEETSNQTKSVDKINKSLKISTSEVKKRSDELNNKNHILSIYLLIVLIFSIVVYFFDKKTYFVGR